MLCLGLGSFDHFAGFQAGSAHAHPLISMLSCRVHWTQVHVPAPLADVVGVADVVAKARAFAANLTYSCHFG